MQKDQQPPKQETIPIQILAPYQHACENEINLADLWRVLVAKKKTLLICIVFSLFAGIIYLAITDNTYKTAALTLPPSLADVQPLNTTELFSVTSDEIYVEFLTNMGSVSIQRKAFDQMISLDSELAALKAGEKDQLFNQFAEKIVISPPDKENADRIQATALSMETSTPKLSQSFLNHTIEQANKTTIQQHFSSLQKLIDTRIAEIPEAIERLTLGETTAREQKIIQLEEEVATKRSEINQRIEAIKNKLEQERLVRIAQLEEQDVITRKVLQEKIATLQEKAKVERLAKITRLEETQIIERSSIKNTIKVLRANAKDKRLDRISQLKEALNIATSLDIVEPVPGVSLSSSTSPLLYAEIKTSTNEPPLYLRGEKALRAEIKELELRKSDDAFIIELRPLLDRLAQLEQNEEIEALKKRSNDDPYIPELPDLLRQLAQLETNEEIEALKARKQDELISPEIIQLQKELKLLKAPPHLAALKTRSDDTPFTKGLQPLLDEKHKLASITLEPQLTSAAKVDRAAYTSSSPIKPNASLTLILALIAGLILGILAAFLSHVTQQRE